MPRSFPRSRRIADQIQREISDLIRGEVKDPRIGMVTLTDVEVTRDLHHAKIFFTSLGDTEAVQDCLKALNQAAGFLRGELSRRLSMRQVPDLHFVYDPTVERGVRLSTLIDSAVRDSQDE